MLHYHIYRFEGDLCVESSCEDPIAALDEWLQSERHEGIQMRISSGPEFPIRVTRALVLTPVAWESPENAVAHDESSGAAELVLHC